MSEPALDDLLRQVQDGALDIMHLLPAADALADNGHLHAATTLYHAWIAKNPDDPLLFAVLFNCGAVWSRLQNLRQAGDAFQRAIDINPDFIPPYINLGNVLEQSGDRAGAIARWQAAANRLSAVTRENIDFKLMALKQMARVLAAADLDEVAEEALAQSIVIDLHDREVLQHWYNLRQRQCRWPLLHQQPPATCQRVLAEMSPLSLASFKDDPLWQLGAHGNFTLQEVGRPALRLPDRPVIGDPNKRPLRIGYLSADLCEHAIGYLTAEIYGLHDRQSVRIHAYHNGRDSNDRIQRRIKESVDQWRDLREIPDDVAAGMIAEDEIDILVDLSGHTKDARTALLACNPAPIIVNWLGFPGTMGSAFHHYIIADPVIIPPGSELYFSERVVRLPCYQPIDRQRLVATAKPTREEDGLPPDAMVYCCFNEPRKITEATWMRWLRILQAVPDSVLWLLIPAASTQLHLRDLAAKAGIAPERLVFAGRRNNEDHLARYALADLILDSFPYGAHTTASDALWMNVPVVTMTGQCFASRVCGSLLCAVGLEELVCDNESDYFEIAAKIGRDPDYRAALQRTLREGRGSCLLFDTPRLVTSLEDLYRTMWQEYTSGKMPRPNLTNLPLYHEIGVALAEENLPAADYQRRYREELAARSAYRFVAPDRRLNLAPQQAGSDLS